jgi:hypothetical protein
VAAEVNRNFSDVADAVDDNDSRITNLETDIDIIKSVSECSSEIFSVTLTTTTSDINSVQITVPGSGFIVVSGSGTFSVTNDGTQWEGDIWITDISNSSDGDVRNFWGGPSGLPAGSYFAPFHEQRRFVVGAAGTYTFFLTGKYFNTQSIRVFRSNVCAIFTPD